MNISDANLQRPLQFITNICNEVSNTLCSGVRTVSRGDWGFVCVWWEANWWWLSKKLCTYLGLRAGVWGKGIKILDFSCSIFSWFLIFVWLNLSNDFYLTKVEKFFGDEKIIQMLLYLQRMVYKMISPVATLLSFVLKNAELIVLFTM